MRGVILVLLGAIAGCPSPRPTNPPEPDVVAVGDGGTACQRACRNLNALGCPEGLAQDCVSVCAHSEEQRFTNLHLDCAIGAANVEAMKACGYPCR